jgi:hypothetical protein
MNKRAVYIAVATLFILGGVLIYFIQGQNKGASSGYKSSDWYVKYGFDSKDPYGLYYFNSLLEQQISSTKIQHISNEDVLDSLLKKDRRTLYVLIGDTVTLKPNQFQQIISKVTEGDGLILFTTKTYNWVYDSLDMNGEISYAYDREIPLRTGDKTYTLHHLYQADTIYSRTFGMMQCSKPALSSNNGLLVETKFPMAKGEVLVGFFPRALVNYQLKNPAGLAHANMLIRKIKTYDRVLFLSYATLKWQSEYEWEDEAPVEKDSLLKLINEHPALKNAVYALLIGLLLLVFFAGKRRRAIVPLPEAPSKLTTNYIQTISSIYQSHESPEVAFNLVKQQFFHAILRAYYVDISKYPAEDQVRVLKEKTGLDERIIQEVLRHLGAPSDEVDMTHVYQTAGKSHRLLSQAGIIKTLNNPKQFPIIVARQSLLSFTALMLGFILSFIGFYSVSHSNAMGPGIAVIGGLLFGLGILRFRTPMIRIEDLEHMYYLPLLGQRVPCKIIFNEQRNELEFYSINGNRTLAIPRWDSSSHAYLELVTFIKQKQHGRIPSNG